MDFDDFFETLPEEDAAICHTQAVFLLDHLDPNLWAIQAGITGIQILPRHQVHGITTWERTLPQLNLQIPSEWIGALSRIDAEQQRRFETSLATRSSSEKEWLKTRQSQKQAAVAFSLTRLLSRMEAYLSDGQTQRIESTPEPPQSRHKGRIGSRQKTRGTGEMPSST